MNYIGSKFSILSYIDEVVEDFTKLKKDVTFCDIFSGTGVVSKYFKEKGYNIISNDIQYFSYATLKGLIENSNELEFERLRKRRIDPFVCLNGLSGKKGFTLGKTRQSRFNKIFKRLAFIVFFVLK